MSEWKRIDAIADVRRGASPRPIGDPKYFGGEVGWVRISDVTRTTRFLRETEHYVSPLGESLSVRVKPGDLVMSICGTLGRPIIIDMPACIHDGFVQFSNLRDADTTFLFYALQHAERAFYGMGQPGTQTNLNTSLVGRHRIFTPKREEQLRIAEILSTLDEAIEQTEALIGKYQSIKTGLMHNLFTRGLTPDGRLRPTRADAPHLYKESPLGWIPKEWETRTIGDIADSLVDGPFGSNLKT
jgi:type I restriction enzyme S subunit